MSGVKFFVFSMCVLWGAVSFAQTPTTQPSQKTFAKQAIKFILSDGPAPCAIHMHAVDVPLAAGTPITARYEWDFGDPHGRFNSLVGWNAAHIYDQPGRYTIQLKIHDEAGSEQIFRGTITVGDDNRRTIFVDPTGDDANSGVTEDRAVKSLERAASMLGNDTKLLLKRGQTFPLSKTIDVRGSNILIGAFGEGDRPKIVFTATKGSVINCDSKIHGLVIENLSFNTPPDAKQEKENEKFGKLGISAIFPRGTNIAVRGCEFLNLDDAINANGKPTGLFVIDNIAPLETGLRGYFVWLQNSDTTIVGNKVANSTREHIVRSSSEQTQRVLIAYNDFTNAASSDDKDDIGKTTFNFRAGKFAYVTHNDLAGGPIAMGPSLDQPVEYHADSIVIEANRFNKNSLQIYPNTRHVFVRNNTFSKEGSEQILVLTSQNDRAGGTVGVDARVIDDLSIVNNTGVNNSPRGKFIKVDGPLPPGVMTVANNVYVAPNLDPSRNFAAGLQVLAGDLSGFKLIRGNVWPGVSGKNFAGVNYVSAGLNNSGYVSNDAWNKLSEVKDDAFLDLKLADPFSPPTDMPAVKSMPGVFDDLNGNPRGESCTAGAVQLK